MEDLPLGRIAALVPEFAVKDLPLGRTLMMMIYSRFNYRVGYKIGAFSENELRRVAGHMFRRCAACQIIQGHHFEHEL